MKISFSVNPKFNQEEVIKKTEKVLFDSMLKMQEIAIQKAPTDMGSLAGSIHLNPMSPGFREYVLSARIAYAEGIEYGTSPHFVPIEPLKGWAARKLGDQSLAWAVQKKIAMKGTSAQPFFRPAMFEVKDIWIPRYWKENLK